MFKSFFFLIYRYFYYPFFCWPRISHKKFEFHEDKNFSNEFEGFKSFYEEKIQQLAQQLESDRVKILKKIVLNYRIFWVAMIIVFFVICQYPKIFNMAILILLELLNLTPYEVVTSIIILLILAFFCIPSFLERHNHSYVFDVKDKLYRLIIESFFGFKYLPEGSDDFSNYMNFRIFPDSGFSVAESSTSDLIAGNHKNATFLFEEVILSRLKRSLSVILSTSWLSLFKKYKTKEVEVFFSGHAIRIVLEKKFEKLTVIKSDRGFFGNLLSKTSRNVSDLQKVSLEDREFEKIFEVYSEDQVEARYLLSPAFMEKLKNLSKIYGKTTVIEGSFHNKQLLLLISAKKNLNLFEPKSARAPINLADDCKMVIKHMNVIFAIIESLQIS